MKHAVLLLVLAVAVAGCAEERTVTERISEGALRVATANGSAAELRTLGYLVQGKITCVTPAGNTRALVRVECTGTTVDRQPIRVEAVAREADTYHPEQEFVITVGGAEVLRTDCLDTGCKE
ncbi:MAG: hypothetical protein ABIS86_10300 [Streptosporangiaceae bacterium]